MKNAHSALASFYNKRTDLVGVFFASLNGTDIVVAIPTALLLSTRLR